MCHQFYKLWYDCTKQSFNYFSDKRETLWIQSIDGNTISSKQIFKGNNKINISQLNKGIYIIKVIDRMQKLIVKQAETNLS